MMGDLPDRENLAGQTRELWRPPLFAAPGGSAASACGAAIRRLIDLQAGSIWKDLSAELPKVSGSVLDVGCGAQPYRGLFSKNIHYRGIDTKDAGSGFGYETPDTVYYSGDRWPVESKSVDFILCTETLEHVMDTAPFLSEIRRCLRPGGKALLTVPFSARWHYIPHDYWRFTPSGLHHLFSRAGFVKIAVYGRGNQLTVLCNKLITLVLSLLMSRRTNLLKQCLCILLGLLCSPLVILFAILGNLSIQAGGPGDDCLGYTALIESPIQ